MHMSTPPFPDPSSDSSREWLVTNGLGGYASGTVSGTLTRRYHGLLIAAPGDYPGRYLMLNLLDAAIETSDQRLFHVGEQVFSRAGETIPLVEFRMEQALPVWRFQSADFEVEKRLLLNHGQNTAVIRYLLLRAPSSVRFRLRPGFNFRGHDDAVSAKLQEYYPLTWSGFSCEIPTGFDSLSLRMQCDPPSMFIPEAETTKLVFAMERSRGYDSEGGIYSPGYFTAEAPAGQALTLIASTETLEVMNTLNPAQAQRRAANRRRGLLQRPLEALRNGTAAELVLAADQFIFRPPARHKDEVWARAAGDEVRTVIAGYHWFGDWGRDTMISLEGLTLITGRHTEAGWILRTFAHYVNDGLIPNLFPEGQEKGLYHTADASLWFFHALARYLDFTYDVTTLGQLMPRLQEIMNAHLHGTRFGIRMDPQDSLLRQGAEGYQLTWMDAKVEGWVVTPRRGKAVEINALWYNAVCCMAGWMKLLNREDEQQRFSELAGRIRVSFNQRFWCSRAGRLYDVVDGEGGDDLACRPNQVFAISLPHPVLDQMHWEPVMDVVTRELLTPFGLRSLSPKDPNYKSRYDGDLRARDAAYHQGSVWAWLIGPYIDAWMKLHPGQVAEARRFLEGFETHLKEACVGSISEIFDGDAPHTPRGCIAQAWSVAEVLRCWAKTIG